ncbi:MAG: HEAT repeat domain-containing protein [Candidatus Heimdallarchaeaceae archaeon]
MLDSEECISEELSKEEIDQIIKDYKKEKEKHFISRRITLLNKMIKSKNTAFEDIIIQETSETDPEIKRLSIIGLGKIQTQKTFKKLTEILSSDDDNIAVIAASVLADWGEIDGVNYILKKALDCSKRDLQYLFLRLGITIIENSDYLTQLQETLEMFNKLPLTERDISNLCNHLFKLQTTLRETYVLSKDMNSYIQEKEGNLKALQSIELSNLKIRQDDSLRRLDSIEERGFNMAKEIENLKGSRTFITTIVSLVMSFLAIIVSITYPLIMYFLY